MPGYHAPSSLRASAALFCTSVKDHVDLCIADKLGLVMLRRRLARPADQMHHHPIASNGFADASLSVVSS